MAVHARKGPLVVFGKAPNPGYVSDDNAERSPSLIDQGAGIMDPRSFYHYYPDAFTSGQGAKAGYGWWGIQTITIVDQVPSTLTTTAIAAAQVPVAGTAMTLVAATGAGITVGASITRADTGVAVSGLLAIDGAMGTVQNADTGGSLLWDPTKALARNVQIQSLGDDHLGTFTVRGYDVYGYPVTETITGANIGTAVGVKAFKYIASVTPAGTLSGANASVGQGDAIGFMLRNDRFQYLKIYWPDTTLIAASTGWTAAVTTSPATATTGDVRGTFNLTTAGTASNNARRLIIFQTIPVGSVGTTTGLLGVTQFKDF